MFEEKIDSYGDLFTIEEFRNCVEVGLFIPDDGCGYYGNSTNYTYSGCIWSDPAPEGATHIHWYNK